MHLDAVSPRLSLLRNRALIDAIDARQPDVQPGQSAPLRAKRLSTFGSSLHAGTGKIGLQRRFSSSEGDI